VKRRSDLAVVAGRLAAEVDTEPAATLSNAIWLADAVHFHMSVVESLGRGEKPTDAFRHFAWHPFCKPTLQRECGRLVSSRGQCDRAEILDNLKLFPACQCVNGRRGGVLLNYRRSWPGRYSQKHLDRRNTPCIWASKSAQMHCCPGKWGEL